MPFPVLVVVILCFLISTPNIRIIFIAVPDFVNILYNGNFALTRSLSRAHFRAQTSWSLQEPASELLVTHDAYLY